MAVTLPKIRVGDPVTYQSLAVFPLFAEPETGAGVAYRLAHEAIADKSLKVSEVSESGSVPELFVENQGESRVLFIEGEELVGAKQNRILNTSVLVAPRTKVKIPVSCVEQGRWGYRSRHFQHSGSQSPSKLRYALKQSVSHSAMTARGHRSDQAKVWDCVQSMLQEHEVSSATSAMSEAFQAVEKKRSDYRERLQYIPDAIGVAVAVGKNVVTLDVFDKPETCRKVWDRLLSGAVLDAVATDSGESHAVSSDVTGLLASAEAAAWKQVAAVGEGEEYRAELAADHASALSFEGTVVHGSVVLAH